MAELCGRIKEGLFRIYLEPEGATEKLAALVEQALPVFEAAGDDLALYIGYSALGQVATMRGADGRDGSRHTSGRPTTLGGQACRDELVACRAPVVVSTARPRSRSSSRGWTSRRHEEVRDHYLRRFRAMALAMLGRFDEARALLAEVACGAGRPRRGNLARR